ncbi:MAG: DUF3793 family protein [Lachnospiraceae bacterium]|nr:DUF3793 family protein [Lachnospiraceae bacterium]
MLETGLIEQCAPTLAGLKTANLFSCRVSSEEMLNKEIRRLNRVLNGKGVYVELLLKKEDFALIYVYRKSFLERDLQKEEVQKLLRRFGYHTEGIAYCIRQLEKRLAECDGFPHEIGVFLGYPIQDVIGFIKHKGQNCKCCGIWKVYDNEQETVKLFEKLQKCSRVYAKVFSEGRALSQMCVVA